VCYCLLKNNMEGGKSSETFESKCKLAVVVTWDPMYKSIELSAQRFVNKLQEALPSSL